MFSWTRALYHVLISLVLVFAGVLVLAAVIPAVLPSVRPDTIAAGAGDYIIYILGATFGISYLAQTGRRRAARLVGIGFVVLTVGPFLLGFFIGPLLRGAPAKPFTAADRAPLVEVDIGGEHRLKHPTLGFSILRPPPSYSSSQMAKAMGTLASDPGSVVYAYAEDPPRARLIVFVLNNLRSRRDFQRVLDDFRGGMERSIKSHGGSATVQVVRNDVTGDDAHLEAHLHVVMSGWHTQLTAYALHVPAHSPALVAVMVVSPEATTMADVLASFRPQDPR